MLKIAICDDNQFFCSEIETIILKNKDKLNKQHLNIDIFYSGQQLYSHLNQNHKYDIIFLDIEMESLNGVEVGKKIRNDLNDDDTQIIYVSSNASYAMQLFQNRPANFLIKPVKETDIVEQLKKSIAYIDRNKLIFSFSNNKDYYNLSYKDIIYFESRNRKVIIHTVLKDYEIYAKLSDIMDTLPSLVFFKIHKSYVINYNFIQHIDYDSITLTSGLILPISQSQRKTVRLSLLNLRREFSMND